MVTAKCLSSTSCIHVDMSLPPPFPKNYAYLSQIYHGYQLHLPITNPTLLAAIITSKTSCPGSRFIWMEDYTTWVLDNVWIMNILTGILVAPPASSITLLTNIFAFLIHINMYTSPQLKQINKYSTNLLHSIWCPTYCNISLAIYFSTICTKNVIRYW